MQNKIDLTEEKNRIKRWLSHFKIVDSDWLDGDSLSKEKTADFVNPILKIAIELKREKGEPLTNQNKNLPRLSNRMENYFNLSNEKFKNYPDYKTLCLIEFTDSVDMAVACLKGIISLHGSGITSVKNNQLLTNTSDIGGFVFWPAPSGIPHFNKCYYIENPLAAPKRKIDIKETEQIFGNKLENPFTS